MLLRLLKSKIHQATVTEVNLYYSGSITIDEELMEAAGLLANEIVMIADLNNGNRLMTYVIPGPRGSRVMGINGAAARLISAGDEILVFSFAYVTPEEAREHKSTVLVLDKDNRIKETIRH